MRKPVDTIYEQLTRVVAGRTVTVSLRVNLLVDNASWAQDAPYPAAGFDGEVPA